MESSGSGTAQQVEIKGRVSRRRNFDHVVFMVLADVAVDVLDHKEEGQTFQVVINLEQLKSSAELELCTVGSQVSTVGHLERGDREGVVNVIVIEPVRLLKCAAEPNAILRVIDAFERGDISRELTLQALSCNEARLRELIEPAADRASAQKRPRRAELSAHARILAGCPPKRSRQRGPHLRRADMLVLESLEGTVRLWPMTSVAEVDVAAESECAGGAAGAGAHRLTQLVPINIPADSHNEPSSRGPQTRGEYAHGKKAPQIRWILDRLRKFPAFKHVLDVGGGRGDLALLIAQVSLFLS